MAEPKEMQIKDLNCVAYLVSLGIMYKRFKRLGLSHGLWYFEATNEVKNEVNKFLRGKVEVDLLNFLYQRGALKDVSRKTKLPLLPESHEKIERHQTTVIPGQGYFYVENDQISHAVYAMKSPHTERLAAKNFFPTARTAREFHESKI